MEAGGFGTAVSEWLATVASSRPSLTLVGLPDRFIDHGTPAELHAQLGMDAAGIARTVRSAVTGGFRA